MDSSTVGSVWYSTCPTIGPTTRVVTPALGHDPMARPIGEAAEHDETVSKTDASQTSMLYAQPAFGPTIRGTETSPRSEPRQAAAGSHSLRRIEPKPARCGRATLRILCLIASTVWLASCGRSADLVVYVALDQVFSEELINEFEQETGLVVDARFDIEQSKTVGLVQAIVEEQRAGAPRCDVFWNNEVGHTVRLAEEGLLAAYRPTSAEAIPASFRDPENRWTGFAARARVLIVNTDQVSPEEMKSIAGLDDIFNARWKGKVGIARPLTGTTMTHAAALYERLGEDRARSFWKRVQAAGEVGDIAIVTSNGELMRRVSSGALAWGWTDTDDFNVARENGHPVAIIYPDQGSDDMGALLIPNTVCILADAPHPDAARQFVNWVLRPEIEKRLAFSRSAQIPVRGNVEHPEYVRLPGLDFRAMEIDYADIGRALEARGEELRDLFVR